MAESEQMPAGKTGRSDITGLIKTEKKIYPQIYDYELPNRPEMRGMQKVGYTERRDVESRIREQVNTAGLHEPYRLLWSGSSVWPSTGADQHHLRYFKDKDLHRYFEQNKVKRFKPTDRDDRRDEWFDFSLNPSLSRQLFEEFKSSGGVLKHQGQEANYQLRPEQEQAIHQTLAYAHANQTTDFANPNPRAKYLWNAKPRFGKTLSTYDFAKQFKAHNVLIITNRPAIADSWYGDYDKFISGYNFISTTGTLKGRQVMSYEQYANCSLRGEPIIAFLSMQDLKGAAIFGGKFNKLQWVADVIWDLLVIDEAHEGVDTARTDAAFSHINRRFTLHLSGTPFKAIANDYFSDDQIYNWTYADEQRVKAAELAAGNEAGSHVNLPRMNLFTYKISDMIAQRLDRGLKLDLDNESHDVSYCFDLNEMFSVKDGKLVHETEIKTFLDQLTTNSKYPFSTPELRKELKHTFWLVGNRIDSVHALAKLLRHHPVFENYAIIEAVGKRSSGGGDDGASERQDVVGSEKSLDKVRKAIKHHDKTITLSVGQLTTGVTVKEWSAVLMLSDIKSEALYMQALFRAQNPFEYYDASGQLQRKTDAYIFDFSPNRVLEVYDKFANRLSAGVERQDVTNTREANIQELLNYFPVIAEDSDGQMVSLDANQVLTFPNAIRAQQVVKQRFISNLLFENITNVYNIPAEVARCLNKVPSTNESGGVINRVDQIAHDPSRHTKTLQRISVNSDNMLGNRIHSSDYAKLFANTMPVANMTNKEKAATVAQVCDTHLKLIEDPLVVYKTLYHTTAKQVDDIRNKQKNLAVSIATDYVSAKISANEATHRLEAAVREDLPNDTVVKEEEAQEQKEDNDEMSQIRAKLRTFARAIPSMLMAAADPGSLTIDNIENSVDDATFEELFTETSGKDAGDIARFTKADFRMIRGPWRNPETGEEFAGFFNKSTFNASIQKFNQDRRDLANYLNSEEDIFSRIAPLRTNQIFTPRRVVNMMLNKLEQECPDIFRDPSHTFCDLYVKSGLYIAELARRLYVGLAEQIPDERQRIAHIFGHQLYCFAPTKIIYDIARNYIYGVTRAFGLDCEHIHLEDLTKRFSEGGTLDMAKIGEELGAHDPQHFKFTAIVGNPPYQAAMSGEAGNRSARSVYPIFVDKAAALSDTVSMIMPARWMGGDSGMFGSTKDMVKKIKSYGVKAFSLYINSEDVFSGVSVKGGICYFVLQHGYTGNTDYTIIDRDADKSVRQYNSIISLDNDVDDNMIIRYPVLSDIVHKINQILLNSGSCLINSSIYPIVSSCNPFGFGSDFISNNKENVSRVSERPEADDDYRIAGLLNLKRTFRYIPNTAVQKNIAGAKAYKVFLPRANGSGALGEVFSSPMLGEPMLVCTDTFLQIGQFDNEDEAKNLLKYIKTKFFRVLIGIKKTTQHNTQDVFTFVPLQDFTANSDIDWSKPVADVDQQLYKKYGLSAEEIAFIEEKVKPME